KPMVLRDVAEALDLHESTVSRVTAGKFIGTPRGVFELRYFFSRGLSATEDGAADHAAESVKARIRTLVDEEDPKKILSDDKLVKLLKGAGVDIARRTVAKYREAMGIPSSVQRRRIKNMP
ncbi:MAG: RNA polymerase sigma-54 factor, partial [Alphaproteobacteria bacterium]